MEKESERMEHPLHPHALVLKDEIKQGINCSACLDPLSSASPTFSCGECQQFHLHKACANPPSRINHSPFHFHSQPTYLYLSNQQHSYKYYCLLCCERRSKVFFYRCSSSECSFRLDIKCALLLHSNINDEVVHFSHPHQLTLIQNLHHLKLDCCYLCRKPLVDKDSLYACLQCGFYLHHKCTKLPALLHHPSHRTHPFTLAEAWFDCKVCGERNWGLFLRCSPCKVEIHLKCAWPPPIIEDDKPRPHQDHVHRFIRLFRKDMFTCDACGTEGNLVSYICHTCNIQVHHNCISSIPQIIKTTRHHHSITHKYFLQLEKSECQICFNQVKTEYGSYRCSKQDCDFVAHVKCAMERRMYYEVVDEVKDEEEDTMSSITKVIERNEHGEATKIKHFSHEQHDLTLIPSTNSIMIDQEDEKRCDGCMLSCISSSSTGSLFYSCSHHQCDFLLHKTCAELPRNKPLWFHRSLTTLNSLDFFFCDGCNRPCSGFAYEEGGWCYCLRCASITCHILTCKAHQHPLFFDFKFEGKCSGCGTKCYGGGFRCKDHCSSDFALDFACITLPETVRYKCDYQHLLALSYEEKKMEDPEQHYCDVCEEKRDPNLCFYHCADCDKSLHPKCVLGNLPFVKSGTALRDSWSRSPHPHPLVFVRKKAYEVCICNVCGKHCKDEDVALQCQLCQDNNIIHYECMWR